MPNLFSLLPVETYLCVEASTSGFTRSAIGARTLFAAAMRLMYASSASLSTLKQKTRCSSAYSISSRDLPDAGKSAQRRIAARCDHAIKFAAGNDIEPRAFLAQQAQNGAVRVRLHRVADQVVEFAQRRIEPAVVIRNRACAVNIERRAVLLGHVGQVDVFAVQTAVEKLERVQAMTFPRPRRNVQRRTIPVS